MSRIDPLRIATLSDDRPANRAMALGLAEAIARLRPTETGTEAGAATLLIGAGRAGNLAAARARAPGRPAVAILAPPLPWLRFDAVLAPAHDRLRRRGVIETVGALHPLTPEALAEAGRARPLPPGASVALIGGPSRSAVWGRDAAAALAGNLARLAALGPVFATTSRRTPEAVVAALRALPGVTLWTGGKDRPNPYPGWLAGAARVLVTSDSVSMASEAAVTGRPIFVATPGRIAAKLRRFHADLAARGIARGAEEIGAEWTYPPLREADRVAPLLLERLGL
ncbi:MAG: ELM1/GtrOC1 family putative glycosyltransferase [Pseudomonadota bacterium]